MRKIKANGLPVLGLFLAQVLTLAGGLILLELAFGSWFDPGNLANLNLYRNRFMRNRISDLYQSDTGVAIYRRDRYAFRGSYPSVSGIDILTVGGSTTDQRYLTEGETWQDVMADDLSVSGFEVSVVNAGVDGQTTVGHLKNFEWWFPHVPGLRPQYILFYVGANDINLTPDRAVSGGWADGLVRGPPRWQAFIEERSALIRLWRTLSGWRAAQSAGLLHRRRDFQAIHWVKDRLVSDRQCETLMAPTLSLYEERLKKLAGAARQLGAVPVFVTQTMRCYRKTEDAYEGISSATYRGKKITGLDYRCLLRQLNQRTLNICRQSGGICIDLESELDLEDADFYDFYHNTPSGARKIGRYLAGKIKPHLQRNPGINA